MYIPHYINAALPKTMSRTQQVRHTVKSFRIFSLLTTIAAVMCDWTQLNYYTQLSLNDTFWGGVSVSIIVVLGLDVSMFFLGTVLNQYRKATGTTKGNFRFIGIGLLVTFLIAYAISFKKWVSTILLLAITISLCGCSTNRTAASQDEHLTTTTAFIVLNGANVPALNSSAIASFVDTPQDGDRSILIVPDGNPSITTFSFDSTAKNVTYATAESKKWYKEICTSIIDARPDDADTDLLSAILLAANELKASDTQARHLMLLCNGLNTAPMLNFAETPFWSDATSIDEIISQLLKLNYLSADLLEDVDVTWAYLTSTSGLQKSLSPSMESRLLSFWQAYFDACGAKSVVFKKDMLTGPAAADDVPPIQVVNVEPDAVVLPDASADAAKAEEPTLTLDTQTLAFNADSADFANPSAAWQTLDEAAAQLCAASTNDGQFLIAGSVAAVGSNDSDTSMQLSISRAQVVQSALIERGVPQEAISTVLGLSTFPTPLRSYDEEQNRAVYIVDTSTALAQTLLSIGTISS